MAKLPDGRCRRGFDLVPPQELSLRRQKSFHDKGHLRGRYCLGVGKPAPINCSLLRVGAALGAGEKRYPGGLGPLLALVRNDIPRPRTSIAIDCKNLTLAARRDLRGRYCLGVRQTARL